MGIIAQVNLDDTSEFICTIIHIHLEYGLGALNWLFLVNLCLNSIQYVLFHKLNDLLNTYSIATLPDELRSLVLSSTATLPEIIWFDRMVVT